jgi:hypothetical protein
MGTVTFEDIKILLKEIRSLKCVENRSDLVMVCAKTSAAPLWFATKKRLLLMSHMAEWISIRLTASWSSLYDVVLVLDEATPLVLETELVAVPLPVWLAADVAAAPVVLPTLEELLPVLSALVELVAGFPSLRWGSLFA